jgi:hypothetical protein
LIPGALDTLSGDVPPTWRLLIQLPLSMNIDDGAFLASAAQSREPI